MLPDSSTLALFMAAVLALNLTPGPDMLFCFATGVNRGRAAGAVAALGIGAGTLVHTAAAALGLAGLLLASPLGLRHRALCRCGLSGLARLEDPAGAASRRCGNDA